MDGYLDREDISEVIEAALATYDYSTNDSMCDTDAITVIEMLFDTYHFNETHTLKQNELLENCYRHIVNAIEKKLPSIDLNELVKIIGAIYFVARRRNTGHRDYLSIIRQYVGINTEDGLIRIINNPFEK